MESYIVIVLIFGGLILISLIMIYFINQIIQYKTRIDNSFKVVKELIEERINIVNNMLDFLNINLEHEKSYQKKLIQNKELMLQIKNNKDGIFLIKKTEKDIFNFINLENTYKNLSKNKDYLKIKENINSNKEKLIYAMESYDKGVVSYNNYKENKLIYYLSKLCRIPEYDCYNK